MKSSPRPPPGRFADLLRDAIAHRDVTLVWLRDRLAESGNPASLTTLSYWRSGRRNPEGPASLAAIAEIERLLDLPDGHLTDRLGPRRRVEPVALPVQPLEAHPVNDAVEEASAALDAPFGVWRELATHIVADVDADGVLRRRWMRMVLQVTSGTVAEYPWVEVVEGDDMPPVFSQGAGCRVVRTHVHETGTAHGVVLGLDRPVTAPDTTVLEWVTDWPDDEAPTRDYFHGRSREGGAVLVWVRFHPDRVPAWWEVLTPGEAPSTRQPFTDGTTAHVFRRSFGPGVLGLRWGYAGDEAR